MSDYSALSGPQESKCAACQGTTVPEGEGPYCGLCIDPDWDLDPERDTAIASFVEMRGGK